jgi:beta-glucosidase/6-phospho-beta-glucosidase/beta-galactosidase
MTTRARLLLTVEGYAVEGGMDRSGEPMTCYAPTIALGRHGGPGLADDLWRRYEEVLDLVPSLGVEGVRLTLEWARIEPRPGEVDEAALQRYEEVLGYVGTLGLDVTVVLVDAAWPSWLGLEAWLLPWVVPHVVAHARRVVERFNDLLGGVVVFAQPDDLVTKGYLRASAPPWRTRARRDAGFARAQIAAIERALRADELVGPRIVASSATFNLDAAPDFLADARKNLPVEEIYLRSLLRGTGPTSAATGLLVRQGDQWRVHAPEELLAALR